MTSTAQVVMSNDHFVLIRITDEQTGKVYFCNVSNEAIDDHERYRRDSGMPIDRVQVATQIREKLTAIASKLIDAGNTE